MLKAVLSMGKTMPQDESRNMKEFYFQRIWIDIKSHNSMVPNIDYDSVAEYQDLGTANQFYIAKLDENNNLVYLETWEREFIEEINLTTVVSGKPLDDFNIPIADGNLENQKPIFFMLDENKNEWQEVSVIETLGESRFARLRLVASLRSDTIEKVAEVFQQSLVAIEEYSYDQNGDVIKKVRRLESTGFSEEVVFTK